MKKAVKYTLLIPAIVLLIGGGVVYFTMLRFTPAPATAPAAGRFVLRNVATGELLRPQDAKAQDRVPMELYDARPWTCMAWDFRPNGSDTFSLTNYLSGKELTHDAKGLAIQSSNASTFESAYRFIPKGHHTYLIENAAHHVLSVGSGSDPQKKVLQFTGYAPGQNQLWEIIPAPHKLLGPTVHKTEE